VLWLAGFLVIRLFCYVSAETLRPVSLWRAVVLGFAWDLAGAGVAWVILLALHVLFVGRAIARYSLLVLLVPACLLGIVNAMFVGWAHVPLDPSFVVYVDSVGSLLGSAHAALPQWYWVAAFSIAVLAVLGAAWFYGFRYDRAGELSGRWVLIAAAAVLVLLAASVAFHAAGPERLEVRSLSANAVWHFVEYAFTWKPTRIVAGFEGPTAGLADKIRNALVTDQGVFHYLDDEFPLMKYNVSFSRPGGRKGVWDRSKAIRPNIVFLFLESFRAQDLGAYGSRAGLTPNFDALAEKGWLWENFYANGVQTARAALAALCSVHPCYRRGSVARANPSLPLRGLASILKENGYQTEFYHNGSLAFENKKPFFANLGFDVILGMRELDPDGKLENYGGWGYADAIFAGQLAERLNRQPPDEPLLLAAFTVSTHHPYEVPDPRLKIVPEAGGDYPKYQNCIHYCDYALGLFFEKLSERALDSTIFVILSDTCQPMGEHHHNYALIRYLYEENLRVPLLIYAPRYIKQAKRFSDVASQVDITPTLLDMLQVRCVNTAVGRSLLADVDEPLAVFSNPYGWIGARKGRYKYIIARPERDNYVESLYDLESDPGETNNIASRKPAVCAQLRSRLTSVIAANEHLMRRHRIWK
jgi:phosphoglycerol transferase MdoB-like AlkP superfamily enzyme